MTNSELKRLQNQPEIFKVGIGFNWIVLSIAFIVLISMMLQPVSAEHICNYPNGGDVYDGDIVICTTPYYSTYSPTNTGCGAGELGTVASFTVANYVGTTSYLQRTDLAACPPPIYYQWHRIGALPTNKAYVTFIVTQTGNFSAKLSNVSIVLSNTQSTLTSPSGVGTIRIIPNSSTLTYSATKSGYTTLTGGLSGLGEFGGTLYLNMSYPNPNGSVNVQVQDAYTGALIPNSQFQIRDSLSGIWSNQTTSTGLGTYSIGISPIVSQFATANGYQNLTQNYVTLTSGTTDYFNMQLAGVAGIVNRTNVIVYTKVSPTGGISSIPLEGVYTTVKETVNATTSFTDYSNTAGISSFELNTNMTYTFTSSKSGYLTTTQTLNTGTTNPYLVYQYLISKNVISPTPTLPTPYPTATPTGLPTIGAWSNINASVCGAPRNNASVVDYLKAQMACNGFETGLSQSLLLTGLIILICASFGAQYGKGVGGILGAGVGFCLSFALGIIPFMFMAILLVVLVLILAIFLLAKFGK